jgi:hypothetical protein
VEDEGFHVLSRVKGSYAGLGRKELRLGEDPIDGYVSKLANLKGTLQVNGKLIMTDKLRCELQKGTFTFAPVTISEPSRFAEHQTYMANNIHKEVNIPVKYTSLFTMWSYLSRKIKAGVGYELALPNGERVQLTAVQTRAQIRLLCNKVIDKS